MPKAPEDLIPFTQILQDYSPSRWWWDERISRGDITAYAVAPHKGKFLSKAAVEALLEPRALPADGEQERQSS